MLISAIHLSILYYSFSTAHILAFYKYVVRKFIPNHLGTSIVRIVIDYNNFISQAEGIFLNKLRLSPYYRYY